MVFKPHTTVATIVENRGALLFVEEQVRGTRVINQPSGHLEAGETLFDAALRETLEETGCQVTLQRLVGIYQWHDPVSDKAFLRFTFSASLDQHNPDAPLDEGIERIRWLTLPEFRAQSLPLRSPVITRSLDDYAAGPGVDLNLLHWVNP
ncbi:MAG: NUDIX hydrolase [Lysobacterales bacterium]